jgi:hypothetical protein
VLNARCGRTHAVGEDDQVNVLDSASANICTLGEVESLRAKCARIACRIVLQVLDEGLSLVSRYHCSTA